MRQHAVNAKTRTFAQITGDVSSTVQMVFSSTLSYFPMTFTLILGLCKNVLIDPNTHTTTKWHLFFSGGKWVVHWVHLDGWRLCRNNDVQYTHKLQKQLFFFYGNSLLTGHVHYIQNEFLTKNAMAKQRNISRKLYHMLEVASRTTGKVCARSRPEFALTYRCDCFPFSRMHSFWPL